MAKLYCHKCNRSTKHKRYFVGSKASRRAYLMTDILTWLLPMKYVFVDIWFYNNRRKTTKSVQQCVVCKSIVTICPFCDEQQSCKMSHAQDCEKCSKTFYNYNKL